MSWICHRQIVVNSESTANRAMELGLQFAADLSDHVGKFQLVTNESFNDVTDDIVS